MTNPTLNSNVLQLLQQDLDPSGNANDQTAYNYLIGYIDDSPALINQLNSDAGTASTDLVQYFSWSTLNGSGAFFNAYGTSASGPTVPTLDININQLLQGATNPTTALATSYNEVFVLGHELGHSQFADPSLNPLGPNDTPSQATNTFQTDITQAITSGSDDFTSAIQALQINSNYNESYAQIQGFNAELSEYYAQNNITNPTQAQINEAYGALSGIQGYASYFLQNDGTLRQGLTANPDGSLPETQTNMGTEGDYYYLNPNANLGIFQDQNYTNYNGTGELDGIINQALTSSGNYTVNGSQVTINSTLQIDFDNVSTSNSGSNTYNQSFDASLLAQDMGSYLSPLPGSATSVSFTLEDTSTGTSYLYTVNNGVSSVVNTAPGSTLQVFVGQSQYSAATVYQANASNAEVTIAAGYNGQIDGSNDFDSLGNGSMLVTSAGNTNNTVTCGASAATLNGESMDTCSIASGNSQLTVDGSGLTGSLQGDVVLTESGDTFTAGTNTQVNMASGDTINVGAGTSNVQLSCGSSTETVSGGTSGSDSIQCTINDDGAGAFTNNGSDVTISDAGTGTYSLTGNDDTYSGANGETLTVSGDGNTLDVSDATVSVSGNQSSADIFDGNDNVLSASNYTALSLDGTGDTASGYYDNITLDGGDTATMSNSYSTIAVGDGASLISDGTSGQNTIDLGTDASLEIGNNRGYADTVDATDDQSITLDGGAAADIAGGDNAISAAGNNTITAIGDAITVTGTTAGSETIDGGSDDITATNEAITLSVNSGTSDTILGNNNTISANNYNTFSLDGTGDTASGYYDNITLDDGDSATISDSYSTIGVGDDASLVSDGTSGQNTITLGSDASLEIGNNRGYADTVDATNDSSITLDSGAAATIVGGDDEVTASGSNAIGLSDGSVNASTGTYSLTGNDDTYSGANGETLTVSGDGNVLDVSDATVSVSGNQSSADIFDGNDNVLSASNYTALSLDGTGDTTSGYYDDITLDGGDTATMSNSYSTIAVGDGASLISDGTSGQNTIDLGTDASLEIGNNRGYADTVDATDDQSITLDGGAAADIAGGDNAISAAGNNTITAIGDAITVTGTTAGSETIDGGSDDITATNEAITLSVNSGTSDTILGNNNTISANNYNTFSLDGTGDTASGYYDNITLDDGDSATISDSYSTIGVGDDASLVSDGTSGQNTITLGSDASLEIGNNRGYADTVDATNDSSITLDSGAAATIVGGDDEVTASGSNAIGLSDGSVNASTGTYSLTGNDDTYSGANGETLTVSGDGNVLDVSDATVSVSGNQSSADIFDGNDNVLSASNYTALSLDGTGDTTSGNYDDITLDGGDTATMSNSYSTIAVGDGASLISDGTSGQNTIDLGTDASLEIGNNRGYADTVDATDDQSITLDEGASVDLLGDGDMINATSTGTVSVSGQDDVVNISDATIDVSGNEAIVIAGSNDTIEGGSSDSFTVTGTDDDVSATDSTIDFDGTNTGDDVLGANDTGSNWAAPDPDDTSDEGGYGYGYGYGYAYGLSKWKNKNPTAAQITKAEHSDSMYEGAAWADKTITWSFAGAGNGISSAITNSQEQSEVEQAFQAWAKASGLNFDEVAAGSQADIEVGFGDLNPAGTNEIGLTRYSSQGGTLTGAQVELENPNQAPLATNSSGQLVYANTGATFEQVALHEIGHALGLADTDVAGSIMNAVLGSSNQTLGATDLANVQKLYVSKSGSGTASVAQVHQLVQAMNAFDANEMGVDGFNFPQEDVFLQKNLLSSAYSQAHAA